MFLFIYFFYFFYSVSSSTTRPFHAYWCQTLDTSPLTPKAEGLFIVIAQKKGFDTLNAMQKTSALCNVERRVLMH